MSNLFPFYSIGHFINQPSNRTEFEINLLDEIDEPQVDDIHKHTFYEILWIEKGKSRQAIDYKNYELKPGSLFFISPGQVHEFEEWRPVTGGTLMFTENFFLLGHSDKNILFELSFLDNFYGNPVLLPTKKEFSEILQTIYQLVNEQKRKDPSPPMARALLHVLLLQIQRCVDAQSNTIIPKKYIVIYKKFKSLIDNHYLQKLSVSNYADKLAITQHHLNDVSKAVTGKTATEVIRARSILEAKRLLSFSEHSISEVAAKLGYFDSSNFAKIFKAETGSTPAAFRASISESYRRR